jgi:hypothetical protein
MANVSFLTQLMDYSNAIAAYINQATGVGLDRIIYSTPDLSKRKLRERRDRQFQNDPGYTSELSRWISFFFAFGAPGIAEERQSVIQGMKGGLTFVSKQWGWQIPLDMPVQIDIWGDKEQLAADFVFENRMKLNAYMYRNQVLLNEFPLSGFRTKDLDNPRRSFDINPWYNFVPQETVDNSILENLFVEGETHRSTTDIKLQASFYQGLDPNRPPDVLPIHTIILDYTNELGETMNEFTISGMKSKYGYGQAQPATVSGAGVVVKP